MIRTKTAIARAILARFRHKIARLAKTILSERFVESRILPALLLLMLNLKIWIAFQYRIEMWDAYSYLLNARRFLLGYDPYIFFEILRPPLFPYVISILWKLFGENYYVAAAVQPIFTVAASYVCFLLVKRMFGFQSALVASLFMLVIPEVFLWTNHILVHGVDLLFITASIYFLWRGITGRPEYYPLAAGSLALATLTRYTTLLFVPVFPLIMLLKTYRSSRRLRRSLRNPWTMFWPLFGALVFVLIWLPWLLWNYESVGGNPFASLQYGFFTAVEQEGAYDPTTWYFYIEKIPALLGVPATLLLFVGLVYGNMFKHRSRLILFFWILAFFAFHTAIPNRQTRFYVEWAPPLAAFVGLGATRLQQHLSSKERIMAWTLIYLSFGTMLVSAVNASLADIPRQEGFIRSYDEFKEVSNWLVTNTDRSVIGATDIGPYLSYATNRLFYDTTWIDRESTAKGLTRIQFMKKLGVRLVVVRSDYAHEFRLSEEPNLMLIKSFPNYLVFSLTG